VKPRDPSAHARSRGELRQRVVPNKKSSQAVKNSHDLFKRYEDDVPPHRAGEKFNFFEGEDE
jgi:hypothetical protein